MSDDEVTVFACGCCSRHTGCPCVKPGEPYILAAAQVEARHREAVKRAERAATPTPRLTPVPADAPAQRLRERWQRPPQRARPINGPSLDDTVLAVIRAVAS